MNIVNWEKPKSCIGLMKKQIEPMAGYREALLYMPAPSDKYNKILDSIRSHLWDLEHRLEELQEEIEIAEIHQDDDPEVIVCCTQGVRDDQPEPGHPKSAEADPEEVLV